MLIILNAVETIGRKWFAAEMISHLNTFSIRDYSIDFTAHPFEIKNSDGVVVYKNGGDGEGVNTLLLKPDGSLHPNNSKIVEEAQSMWEEIFQENGHKRHYANVFVDLNFDFDYTDEFQGEAHINDAYCYPVGYDNLIADYRASLETMDNHVISGSFSRHILDKIKEDVGADNVKILNIIRHPCACFVAHARDDDHFENNPTYSRGFHDERLPKSIINAANLIKYDDVETLRFEDIARDGKFTVNGTEIIFPKFHSEMFNDYLTTYEKSYADNALAAGGERLVNRFKTSYNDQVYEYQHLGASKNAPWMLDNLFDVLGYTPVDYDTVMKSNES